MKTSPSLPKLSTCCCLLPPQTLNPLLLPPRSTTHCHGRGDPGGEVTSEGSKSSQRNHLDGGKIAPKLNVFQFFQAVSAVLQDYSLPGGLIKAVNSGNSFQGCPLTVQFSGKSMLMCSACLIWETSLQTLPACLPACQEKISDGCCLLQVKYTPVPELTGSIWMQKAPADGSHPPHPSSRFV